MMHTKDGTLVPIECNPRIHSAICTLEGHPALGKAFYQDGQTGTTPAGGAPMSNVAEGKQLKAREATKSKAENPAVLITSDKTTLKYWTMDQVFLRLGFWKHKDC